MAEADYTVGYGKPPKASQFQKGKSPNPGGERKRPLSLAELLKLELNRTIAVPVLGKKTKKNYTVAAIAAKRFAQRLVDNDFQALKLALEIERNETGREEFKAAKLAAQEEAAAIARGEILPPIRKFTLKLEDDEADARALNNLVANRLAELGYPPDPRLD